MGKGEFHLPTKHESLSSNSSTALPQKRIPLFVKPGTVIHTYNLNTQEAETGGSLEPRNWKPAWTTLRPLLKKIK
jgi:hypothetical protein